MPPKPEHQQNRDNFLGSPAFLYNVHKNLTMFISNNRKKTILRDSADHLRTLRVTSALSWCTERNTTKTRWRNAYESNEMERQGSLQHCLWGKWPKSQKDTLDRLPRRCARLILNRDSSAPSAQMFMELNWLKTECR